MSDYDLNLSLASNDPLYDKQSKTSVKICNHPKSDKLVIETNVLSDRFHKELDASLDYTDVYVITVSAYISDHRYSSSSLLVSTIRNHLYIPKDPSQTITIHFSIKPLIDWIFERYHPPTRVFKNLNLFLSNIFKGFAFLEDSEQALLSQQFLYHPDSFPDLSFLESFRFIKKESPDKENTKINLSHITYIELPNDFLLLHSALRDLNQNNEKTIRKVFQGTIEIQHEDFYELLDKGYKLLEFFPGDLYLPRQPISFLDHYPSYLFIAIKENEKQNISCLPTMYNDQLSLLIVPNNPNKSKFKLYSQDNSSIYQYLIPKYTPEQVSDPKEPVNESQTRARIGSFQIITPFSIIYGHSIPLPLTPLLISTTNSKSITDTILGKNFDYWKNELEQIARDNRAIQFNEHLDVHVLNGSDQNCWLNIYIRKR